MTYDFLVDTYATERIKVLSVWSEFRDEDLRVRPNPKDPRGRSVHEQMGIAISIWRIIDVSTHVLRKRFLIIMTCKAVRCTFNAAVARLVHIFQIEGARTALGGAPWNSGILHLVASESMGLCTTMIW